MSGLAKKVYKSESEKNYEESVRALFPDLVNILELSSTKVNQTKSLTPEVVDFYQKTQLIKLLSPQKRNLKPNLSLALEVIHTAASSCPSAAWCLAAFQTANWLLHYFPGQAIDDVFSADPEAILCTVTAPSGTGIRTSNGLKISGRWSWASGSNAAHWAILCANIKDPSSDSSNVPVVFLAPIKKCQIVNDWDPIGLRGTSSNSIVVTDLEIPLHHAVELASFFDKQSTTNLSLFPLTILPIYTGNLLLAQVPLGIADHLAESSPSRLSTQFVPHEKRLQTLSIPALTDFSLAAAIAKSSRLISINLAQKLNKSIDGNIPLTEIERAQARLDLAYAVKQSTEVVALVQSLSNIKIVNPPSKLQRLILDHLAARAHPSFDWRVAAELFGRISTGQVPQATLY